MNRNVPQQVPQAPSGPLVLIVEDDSSLAKMYALKFQAEGFRVSIANDGARGLQLAAEEKPNIILLDMMLPKYSGIEFLEQLQQHLKSAINIPIIALSNLTEKQEAERALKLGVKEYLAKAMNTPEEVVEKIKKYLEPTRVPVPTLQS
jgi:two-component system alkaline phosphatase synthesis response regulator PhoP